VWQEIDSGRACIVDGDLQDFFGSVDHKTLLTLLAQPHLDSVPKAAETKTSCRGSSRMTSFTFCVSSIIAARLSSYEARIWLYTFLGNPHDIPRDPGPGQARISLTLPEAKVNAAAVYLRCSPVQLCAVLRGERCRTSIGMTAVVPHVIACGSAVLKSMTPQSVGNRLSVPSKPAASVLQQDEPLQLQADVLVVVIFVSVILLVMTSLLFISHKKKNDKTAGLK
jgi:hypothetical protein